MKYVFSLLLYLSLLLNMACVRAKQTQGVPDVTGSVGDVFQGLVLEEVLKIYAPTSDSYDNELCRQHSVLFRDGVRARAGWAMQMLDSTSKVPSGLLAGNVMDMGHYDQCVRVEKIPSQAGPISGRHCMVGFGAQTWGTIFGLYSRIESHLEEMIDNHEFQRNGSLDRNPPDQGFVFSLCIPSSCQPRDLELHLRTTLRGKLRGSDSLRVGELSCSSREDQVPFTWLGVSTIFIFVMVLTAVIVATWRDFLCSPAVNRCGVLQVFSLRPAHQLRRPKPPGNDALPILDGIRVVSMLGIMLFHQLTFLDHTPAINLAESDQNLIHWLRLTVTSTLHIDSFLLLSGLLVCYTFLNNQERKAFNIFRYYLHRFARLAPLLALTVLIVISRIAIPLYSGPLTKASISDFQQDCDKNWHYTLAFLGNFVPAKDICIPHAWTLAVDMQLYWLSPLLLLPLYRWPRVGKPLLGALVLVGMSLSFLVSYTNNLRFIPHIPVTASSDTAYYPTYMRFTPWVIGVGLGYVLYSTKRSSLRLSRTMVTTGWTLSAGLMTAAMLSSYRFHHPGFQNSILATAFFVSLQRPAWALGLAWLILACARGHGGFVNTMLSSHQFRVPSRLSFSIYLYHPFVIGDLLLRTNSPYYMTTFLKVSQFLLGLVLVYVAANMVHYMVELPMINLEKSFFEGMLIGPSGVSNGKHCTTDSDKENATRLPTSKILLNTQKHKKK